MEYMNSGKQEIPNAKTVLKKGKKSKTRKLIYWLLIDLSVAAIIIALLLYRPGRYRPVESETDSNQPKEVSTYITKELGQNVYNNLQSDKPFDIVINQDALNDLLKLVNWPLENGGVLIYAPAALLVPGNIVLMGTAEIEGVKFVVTIELKPQINDQGQMNVDVVTVKVGAMNLTPMAKIIAKEMYAKQVSEINPDLSDIRTKLVASILNQEPFDPTFTIEKKSLRIKTLDIEEGKIKAHLVPYKPASTSGR
jgi:uncharacterized protein YpmS